MGQPHPTLTLILDIDKRLDNPNMQQEIKRDYAYVGNTLIRTHEPASDDAPIENTMHLVLKLGRRRYLFSEDEGADDLWNSFLEHWFYNAFHKLGNHMKIYNRRQREIGMPELVFDWIDLELQNGKMRVRIHTDSNSDILPNTNVWLTTIRTALNSGALGANAEQVTMPAPEYYEKQLEEGKRTFAARLAQEEAARAAKEEEERKEKELQEARAEEAFLESPQLLAAIEDAEATGATNAANAENDEADLENAKEAGDGLDGSAEGNEQSAEVAHISDFDHEAYIEDANYGFDQPLFIIDYSIWEVAYFDGTSRIFNSASNAFIDQP